MRMCHTPFGDGIVTSVRQSDGMVSVSLSWGAVLHCRAAVVGVTDEQLAELQLQSAVAFVSQRSSRRRLSTESDFSDAPYTAKVCCCRDTCIVFIRLGYAGRDATACSSPSCS
jgi:hypothetical protein